MPHPIGSITHRRLACKVRSGIPPMIASFDLFSIGHSNHTIDHFIALLHGAGVTEIADVRSRPGSRRYPWFSARRLSERFAQEGIAYRPMGEALGGRPADRSLFRDGLAGYAVMAATPAFQAGLDEVVAAARNERVCLMCAEREPLDCHRCLLIAPALAQRGLNVGHILADGMIEPHAATEDRLLKLAGEPLHLFSTDRSDRLAAAYRRRAGSAASRAKRSGKPSRTRSD
jgi:uncharacterized protein (DUF488 family)